MHFVALIITLWMIAIPVGIFYLLVEYGPRIKPPRRPEGWTPRRHDERRCVRPLRDFIGDYRAAIQDAIATGQRETVWQWKEAMHAELQKTPPDFEDVLPLLDEVHADPDLPIATYVFQAAKYELSPRYVPVLCEIVASERHAAWHLPAIELLGELESPDAIPALRQALGYRWDESVFGNVPQAALEALRAIGTREALSVIEDARHSDVDEVRDTAAELLERH
jgi:hypothetical protein